jgi:hypothetical protein
MTATAVGGGLLIAAAGAVPAWASAPPAPAGGHSVTITAHPRASGIGPHDVLPCIARTGAAIKPASCGQQTISCVITVSTPTIVGASPKVITATARTNCSAPVDEIYMEEDLGSSGGVLERLDTPTNQSQASTVITRSCVVGSYVNIASALITFPAGYVLTAGTNPIHGSTSITFHTGDCTPSTGGGGGGGGGGCAVHAPSLAGHPAGRHPNLISCS